MSNTRLIFGIVNSQPLGLPQDYYEKVYQLYYKPCLTVLSEFPEIPFVLYYSGTLLEWLEVKHPEATMLINDMVKRKQVELLGGGYYEPVLPMIPNSDRTGHIEMQTIQLRKRFGRRPRGGWLGEMVWEPGITLSLKNSGLDYTFIDDAYLKISGARNDELNYPCLTEDQGKTVMVFPIDTELKKYFLENKPEESFEYLNMRLKSLDKKDSKNRNRVMSIFFHGEEWNGVDVGSWLKEFLLFVQEKRMDLNLKLPGECVRTEEPLKKYYFPTLISGRMVHDRKELPQHETVRSLMAVYPEINLLYSKMMFVNNLIRQIRGDKSRKKTARTGIWKAQQNRIFWYPRNMGDTYRPVRQRAYQELLQSELLARESGIFQPNIVQYDFSMNGIPDYMFQGNIINVYIRKEGARVFELDYLPKHWNYQDTRCHWMQNVGNRDSFIETFYMNDEHPRQNGESMGFSLKEARFSLENVDKDKNRIIFSLETKIPDVIGKKRPVKLLKTYSFKKNGLNVGYEIINDSDTAIEFYFTTEINLSFSSDPEKLVMQYTTRGVKKEDNSEEGNYRDIRNLQITDTKNRSLVSLTTTKNSDLLKNNRIIDDEKHGPIYQGTRLRLGWKKKAEAKRSWSVETALRIDKV